MSDLIELLSDLALLELTSLDMDMDMDMDPRATSLIFSFKKQTDDFRADLTMSANLAAASRHNNDESYTDHQQDLTHYDQFGSLSQSTESGFDSTCAPSHQVNSGLGVPTLSKSSESRSGATDDSCMQENSSRNATHTGSRFEIMNGDHMVINALKQGLPTPQLADTALERPAITGPYYLNAKISSTSSQTSAGLSAIPFASRGNTIQNKCVFPEGPGRTFDSILVPDSATPTNAAGPSNTDAAIRGNATQMKRALFEAPSRIAAGRKKAKGDMDPENREIYRLRQENKQFDDIARIINDARSADGKPSNLTGNAIYGRYKRNSAPIAAARGEIFTPSKLDLHAGTNLKAITRPVPAGFDDNEDRLLVEAYKYVMENTWLLVSKRLEEMTGHVHDPADCANRFAYL